MTKVLPPLPLWQRLIKRLVSLKPLAWLFARLLHHVDLRVLRWTKGRASLTSALTGLPIVTLTTIGAKSGLPRNLPLVGIPHGEEIVIIGSNFGQKHHPAWVHNLRVHPQAEVTLHGVRRTYRARQVEGEAREQLWRMAVHYYPGYENYRRWAGKREIAVFVLTPIDEPRRAA